MRRFEREVVDYKLIEAMLQEMNIINVGMNDEDGFPYVVPMSFGFEIFLIRNIKGMVMIIVVSSQKVR